jgi:hypothetical protein
VHIFKTIKGFDGVPGEDIILSVGVNRRMRSGSPKYSRSMALSRFGLNRPY